MAKGYKSYVFKEYDPVIEALRDTVSGSRMSYAEISDTSGVSVSTVHGWFNGRVRRPQFATVSAVARACGKTGIQWSANSGLPRFTEPTTRAKRTY